MKQTLGSFPVHPATGYTNPRFRLCADDGFVANNNGAGEYIPPGSVEKNYREITPTVVGTQITFPITSDIDSTTDALDDQNTTYSLYLCESNGNNSFPIFTNYVFPASLGTSYSYAALQLYNQRKVALRDTDTYTKNQVNLLVLALITPLTAKAVGVATLVGGTVVVGSNAVAADSKILLTAKDANVTGTLGVPSQTTGVGFTITSTNGGDNGDVAWVIV